jgi:hypothetical protein
MLANVDSRFLDINGTAAPHFSVILSFGFLCVLRVLCVSRLGSTEGVA